MKRGGNNQNNDPPPSPAVTASLLSQKQQALNLNNVVKVIDNDGGEQQHPINTAISTFPSTTTTTGSMANTVVSMIQEETWVTADGTNVFDDFLSTRLELRQLRLSSTNTSLQYYCYPERDMTPLDMTFSYDDDNNDDTVNRIEPTVITNGAAAYATAAADSVDGTGTLVWLAAKALVWAMDQEVHEIFTRIRHHPATINDKRESDGDSGPTMSRPLLICELGCGTGLAGIATLLLSSQQQEEPAAADNLPQPLPHVIFTDIDATALENCRENCRWNADSIPSSRYSHQPLRWGSTTVILSNNNSSSSSYPADHDNSVVKLGSGVVDVILAADVLYDIKSIPALMQTAADLLRPAPPAPTTTTGGCTDRGGGGVMILSHVSRFCLPRRNEEVSSDVARTDSSPSLDDCDRGDETQPYDDLEAYIIRQARSFGLIRKDQFRPHESRLVLHQIPQEGQHQMQHQQQQPERSPHHNHKDGKDEDILTENDWRQLAVIFVFQKE